MVVSQSLFVQSKQYRTMAINSHYLVLFKSPRENRQISVLAAQIRPYDTSSIVDSFRAATRAPYGYLVRKSLVVSISKLFPNHFHCFQVFDFKVHQSDAARLRSNIFSHEAPPICFVANSS